MTPTVNSRLEDFEAVKSAELQYIRTRRSQVAVGDSDPLKGLALSGGGIRSAVFCLGVLQALASENLLKHFDYLSTVSGGGYIGAALTWWTSGGSAEREYGVEPGTFPWGVEDPASTTPASRGSTLLTHLRQHGSYLVPGHGITLWSGVGVVLRGIALNLLVWLPLTVLLLAAGLLHPIIYPGLLWATATLAAVFLALSAAYSLSTARERSGRAQRYRYRRWFEERVGSVLLWTIGLLVVGTLPYVASGFQDYVGKAGGPVAFIVGVVGGIYGHFQSPGLDDKQKGAVGIPLTMVAPVAAFLALYGFLLIAWDLASLGRLNPDTAFLSIFGLPIVALVSGIFVNLNYIGLHRFYRDRFDGGVHAGQPSRRGRQNSRRGTPFFDV